MNHILLIVLTIYSPVQEVKDFKFEIPYSNIKECLHASRNIDFSSIITGKIINTKSECIPANSLEI